MDISHVVAVFRNDRMNSSEWRNTIGEPMRVEPPVRPRLYGLYLQRDTYHFAMR
jgi:hypothetical protein